MKRDEKYKGCLLPVIDNWNVFQEISYYNGFSLDAEIKTEVRNVGSLYEGFSDVINFGFYYSFNTKLNDDKVGHSHAHSFEEVIREVYYYPESFSIDEEDYEYYSKQELLYLKRLQNFLKIAGLKDLEKFNKKILIERSRDSKVRELMEYRQLRFKRANEVINGEIDKLVVPFISDKFLKDYKSLVVDYDGNYLGIIDVKEEKIKFEDIKNYNIRYDLMGYNSMNEYMNKIADDIKDYSNKDYVIVEHYQVISKFDMI